MAVILQMIYSKKLGLPNFSSHSCSVSVTVEIPDVSVAAQESTKLYQLLQTAVDNEIQQVGYLPDASTYGMNKGGNGNGEITGNGHSTENGNGTNGAWQCSDKQRGLILDIIQQHRLDKRDVEQLAQELFGTGVKELNRLQASGLIDELLDRHGDKRGNGRPHRGQFRPQLRGNAR